MEDKKLVLLVKALLSVSVIFGGALVGAYVAVWMIENWTPEQIGLGFTCFVSSLALSAVLRWLWKRHQAKVEFRDYLKKNGGRIAFISKYGWGMLPKRTIR